MKTIQKLTLATLIALPLGTPAADDSLRLWHTKPAAKWEEATILGQAGKLEIAGKAGAWTIQVPASAADPVATVVALSFKGDPAIETAAKQPAPAKKKKK